MRFIKSLGSSSSRVRIDTRVLTAERRTAKVRFWPCRCPLYFQHTTVIANGCPEIGPCLGSFLHSGFIRFYPFLVVDAMASSPGFFSEKPTSGSPSRNPVKGIALRRKMSARNSPFFSIFLNVVALFTRNRTRPPTRA